MSNYLTAIFLIVCITLFGQTWCLYSSGTWYKQKTKPQIEQPVKEDKPDCNCINGIDL